MFNAPQFPKLTKTQAKKVLKKQDGLITLHYPVVSAYFDCMELKEGHIRDIGVQAEVLDARYLYHVKPYSFGIVTYRILPLEN